MPSPGTSTLEATVSVSAPPGQLRSSCPRRASILLTASCTLLSVARASRDSLRSSRQTGAGGAAAWPWAAGPQARVPSSFSRRRRRTESSLRCSSAASTAPRRPAMLSSRGPVAASWTRVLRRGGPLRLRPRTAVPAAAGAARRSAMARQWSSRSSKEASQGASAGKCRDLAGAARGHETQASSAPVPEISCSSDHACWSSPIAKSMRPSTSCTASSSSGSGSTPQTGVLPSQGSSSAGSGSSGGTAGSFSSTAGGRSRGDRATGGVASVLAAGSGERLCTSGPGSRSLSDGTARSACAQASSTARQRCSPRASVAG
mmetsp:Transcript_88393/g.286214  ORF Transcript_88393/g.286214 Transcript_88393/m.286214 type:complete len:317 (-) Transcript_88393:102-1052(-)